MTEPGEDASTAHDHFPDISKMVEEMVEAAANNAAQSHYLGAVQWHDISRDEQAIWRSEARAALETLGIDLSVLAALRSGEWVAVPREISDDALFSDPVCEWINRHYVPGQAAMSRPMMKGAYRAMLSAAPKTPEDMR